MNTFVYEYYIRIPKGHVHDDLRKNVHNFSFGIANNLLFFLLALFSYNYPLFLVYV